MSWASLEGRGCGQQFQTSRQTRGVLGQAQGLARLMRVGQGVVGKVGGWRGVLLVLFAFIADSSFTPKIILALNDVDEQSAEGKSGRT